MDPFADSLTAGILHEMVESTFISAGARLANFEHDSFINLFKSPQSAGERIVTSSVNVNDKLAFARIVKYTENAGIDLVNACINGILRQFATARIIQIEMSHDGSSHELFIDILESIGKGCRAAGIVVDPDIKINRMPPGSEWKLSASAAGIAASIRSKMNMQESPAAASGDALIALGARGPGFAGFDRIVRIIHTKGTGAFGAAGTPDSLARKLLVPVKSYWGELLSPIRRGLIHQLIPVDRESLAKSLRGAFAPPLVANINICFWDEPDCLYQLRALDGCSREQSLQFWNGGIAAVAVVPCNHADELLNEFAAWNEPAFVMGTVE